MVLKGPQFGSLSLLPRMGWWGTSGEALPNQTMWFSLFTRQGAGEAQPVTWATLGKSLWLSRLPV